jgi:hypothetical protein
MLSGEYRSVRRRLRRDDAGAAGVLVGAGAPGFRSAVWVTLRDQLAPADLLSKIDSVAHALTGVRHECRCWGLMLVVG